MRPPDQQGPPQWSCAGTHVGRRQKRRLSQTESKFTSEPAPAGGLQVVTRKRAARDGVEGFSWRDWSGDDISLDGDPVCRSRFGKGER